MNDEKPPQYVIVRGPSPTGDPQVELIALRPGEETLGHLLYAAMSVSMVVMDAPHVTLRGYDMDSYHQVERINAPPHGGHVASVKRWRSDPFVEVPAANSVATCTQSLEEELLMRQLTPVVGVEQTKRAVLWGRTAYDLPEARRRLMRGDTIDDSGRWTVYVPSTQTELNALAAELQSISTGARWPGADRYMSPSLVYADGTPRLYPSTPRDHKTKHGRAPRSTKPDRNARVRAKVIAKGSTR